MSGQFLNGSVLALLVFAPVFGLRAAEPPAGSTVTAVQSPAWVTKGDRTVPLAPGMQLADGDRLRTGAGGRVYIALPEHSTVKMGEQTELATSTMDMTQDQEGSLFKGALHILKGVFRFTTSLIGRHRRRQVDIQVGVETIGIRGTDVWGRAAADGDLVALLEGKAEMRMPGHPMMKMDQPMHYMMMPKQGRMQMNMPVTHDKLLDWAAQTDVQAGSGVLESGRHWVVALISSIDDRDTLRLKQTLADAGYPSIDTTVTVRGRQWHRLVIRQVASYRDARALADRLGKAYPLMSPWVFKDAGAG